jgi:hypothetical protein
MSRGINPGKVKLREIMTSPVLAVGLTTLFRKPCQSWKSTW